MQNTTFSTEAEAARRHAVDKLHAATAIYTAAPVVDALLDRIDWPNGDASIADCSAGDGQFLTRALSKLLNAGHVDDDKIHRLIMGWEIHPAAAAQARARIAAVLISFGRSAARAAEIAIKIVRNQDFLTEGPSEPCVSAIIGNPPYLRMVSVPALLREEYSQVVPKYAFPDLMFSFLDRCSKVLRPGGQMGFIVSDRWLANSSAAALREELGSRLAIEHIERLEAESVFYRPKQRRAGTPARVHPVLCVLGATGQPITKAAIYPGIDPAKYAAYPTLDSIAQVRIAPWLDAPEIWALTKDQVRASGIPHQYLVPAVDTDDIRDGVLGAPRRFAIQTMPKERPCEEIVEHLRSQMHRMSKRGLRILQSGKWAPPERFHNFDLSQPSLLVPRIAKTPKAVRVRPGILPINHNLSIVSTGPESLKLVERALASKVAAEWMRDHAPRLEDGYHSLCTTLLRKMPVDLS
jgi:hypothetical protein